MAESEKEGLKLLTDEQRTMLEKVRVEKAGMASLAEAKIAESIKKGGVAIGRSKAMPPNSKLSDADVANLVAYVKTLKK